MVSFGDRLRDERTRLGMTQERLGELAGVTRKTQRLYESGERTPGADYLAAVAAAGVDVLFVLTGQSQRRTGDTPSGQEPPLAPDERILLDNYRHSPPEAQAALKATSDAFARRTGKKAG